MRQVIDKIGAFPVRSLHIKNENRHGLSALICLWRPRNNDCGLLLAALRPAQTPRRGVLPPDRAHFFGAFTSVMRHRRRNRSDREIWLFISSSPTIAANHADGARAIFCSKTQSTNKSARLCRPDSPARYFRRRLPYNVISALFLMK